MAYATETDLAEYLDVDLGQLPDDAERLLERASEDVDYYTLGRVRKTNYRHQEALKKATCAQVERWIVEGDDTGDITQAIQSFSIGRWSQTYANAGQNGTGGPPSLAPRARRALFLAGLLYRGVGMR